MAVARRSPGTVRTDRASLSRCPLQSVLMRLPVLVFSCSNWRTANTPNPTKSSNCSCSWIRCVVGGGGRLCVPTRVCVGLSNTFGKARMVSGPFVIGGRIAISCANGGPNRWWKWRNARCNWCGSRSSALRCSQLFAFVFVPCSSHPPPPKRYQ